MRIITVSREFGSGGRELGKRLADILQINYYDREIITMLAEQSKLDEHYLESVMDNQTFRSFPVTYGRTFLSGQNQAVQLLVQQHNIIKAIAEKKQDFVIVGRSADVLLQEYHPFRLFVYAEMQDKQKRCRAYDKTNLSDKELQRKIRQIDKNRAECHAFVSDTRWGDKKGYQLCVNTSGMEIKQLAEVTAEFAKTYFRGCQA